MSDSASIVVVEARPPFMYLKRQLQAILTLRGVLIAGLVVFLFVGPVLRQVDIVAAVLACSLLGLLILIGAVSVLKGRALRRSLQLHLTAQQRGGSSFGGETLLAGEPALLVIKTSPFRVPPLFVLQVRIEFEYEDLPLPLICFVGGSAEPRVALERVVFPHRGVWSVGRLRLSIGDRLGLTSFFWDIDALDAAGVFTVTVREHEIETLPIVSSSNKAGDMEVNTRDRLGDPFDLKPYHPADGLKRILWKVYAKSGQLIARHPECSMTPEGQVVLFCCARDDEDYLCADFLAYLSRLESMDLALAVGFEGMRDHQSALSRREAETLMTESVWDAEHESIEQLQAEISGLIRAAEQQGSGTRLHRLVFFVGAERIEEAAWLKCLVNLGNFIRQQGVVPCFIVRKRKGIASSTTRLVIHSRPVRKLLDLFMDTPERPMLSSVNGLQALSAVCGKEGWEMVA